MDDGPQSLEESLSMASRAVEDGIHTIVATPHTLNGVYNNSTQEVSSKVDSLQDFLSKNHINLRICAGADVHLCPQMIERIEAGEAGTINNNGKYMLLELPSHAIIPGVKAEIFALKMKGITPIITHPERHSAINRDMDILYELVRMGALSQVTAMSITGDFGGTVRQCAEVLLKHRLVHVIASDAHSPEGRPPVLSRAVDAAAEIVGSYEEAVRMVKELPAAILSGERVEIPEPMPTKGSRF